MNLCNYANILDQFYSSTDVKNKFGYRIPIEELFSIGNGGFYYNYRGDGYSVSIYPNSVLFKLW